MWVKCMYNWVVNGILASLNNKELFIFDNGNDPLYIESTNWLLCWKKKRQTCILKMNYPRFSRNAGNYWSTVCDTTKSQAEFDLVCQPSQRWKVAPIQQSLSKERKSLIFLFLLLCVITGFTFHFVSLSLSVTTASYLFTEYFLRYLNIALFRNKSVHAAKLALI